MRFFSFFLILICILAVGCGKSVDETDKYGCLVSDGYSWCESKHKCLRIGEEDCPVKMTLEGARAIAAASGCVKDGALTEFYFYNENTKTWWFDLDIKKEGCAPACVVSEETMEAEINWRCTGLVE